MSYYAAEPALSLVKRNRFNLEEVHDPLRRVAAFRHCSYHQIGAAHRIAAGKHLTMSGLVTIATFS